MTITIENITITEDDLANETIFTALITLLKIKRENKSSDKNQSSYFVMKSLPKQPINKIDNSDTIFGCARKEDICCQNNLFKMVFCCF